jgi:hypothetical protein
MAIISKQQNNNKGRGFHPGDSMKTAISNWVVRTAAPNLLDFCGRFVARRKPEKAKASHELAESLRELVPATNDTSSTILLDTMTAKLWAAKASGRLD